jgi:hypothetical protein
MIRAYYTSFDIGTMNLGFLKVCFENWVVGSLSLVVGGWWLVVRGWW